MGQALSEETRYVEGLPVHASLLEYRVPTIAESPPIEVQIVESHDPNGPFGAKEASEGALAGFPPALINAVANAIGIDMNELPVDARPHDGSAGRTAAPRDGWAMRGGRRHDGADAQFHIARPRDVEAAIAARREHPSSRFLAGGTDLVVNLRHGLDPPDGADRPRGDRRTCRRSRPRTHGVRIGAGRHRRGAAALPDTGRALSRRWPKPPRRSPVRATAPWRRSAAICASTRAASSTIRASGGATPTATA